MPVLGARGLWDRVVGGMSRHRRRDDSRAERASLLPLEMNACLPGCVWNATPRSLSPLERGRREAGRYLPLLMNTDFSRVLVLGSASWITWQVNSSPLFQLALGTARRL